MWPVALAATRRRRDGRTAHRLRRGRGVQHRWGGGADPYADDDFCAPHDVCVDSTGRTYIGEVTRAACKCATYKAFGDHCWHTFGDGFDSARCPPLKVYERRGEVARPARKRPAENDVEEVFAAGAARVKAPPGAPQRHAGTRVLVTGGAQGIGRGIADAFAAEGATVIVADIQVPPAEGSPLTFLRCDAGDPGDIERCCARAGPVDVLVNNVAVQPEGPCHEHSLEDWDRAIAINLTSYFLFAKHALPGMLSKGKGVIINIASVQGSQSQPGIPAYAAAKGGVLSLTRQLGVEYAPRGIRINSVSPGTINTPFLMNSIRLRNSSVEKAGAACPMKRIGQVSEIAKVVLFLASDDASFITAENLTVDGGIMGLGGWASVA